MDSSDDLNLPHVYVTKFSIQKKAIPVCAFMQRNESYGTQNSPVQ